jgi:hypothetical protein
MCPAAIVISLQHIGEISSNGCPLVSRGHVDPDALDGGGNGFSL